MRGLIASFLLAACVLHAAPASAEGAQLTDPSSASAAAPTGDSALDHWWLGGYYRHLWVPGYVTDAFLSRAPSISNDGFGFVATYRSGSGLNVEMGVGYMPYGFHGPFLAEGNQLEDTELVTSNLGFFHLTSSVLWDIEFHKTVALEIGVGIDLGLFSGDVIRDEAYLDRTNGQFVGCSGPLRPPVVGPNGVPYCNVPENGSYDPKTGSFRSDSASAKGEQYNVRENHVPPLMLFPMLPHLALRLQPFKHLMFKVEFAFGAVQMWAGVSLHASFGLLKKGPQETFVKTAEEPIVTGRVLGKVVATDSNAPIAGASVRVMARALSPLTSEADGRFVVDRLDPGLVRFEIEHPDYAKGECQVDIPKAGGDVAAECHLEPRPRLGAISGQVTSEDGQPVSTHDIELSGSRDQHLASDEHGQFAAVDLPAGAYRIRVEAEDYLVQMVEVEVASQETAMPQIILIKKPKRALVQLRKQEIVIAEQVQFTLKSAEIAPASENLLRQVADVLLRNPQIERVEVQGHTDSTGSHEMNMQLSQQRANSVRAWLIKAGIPETRLEAVGYGPDHPINPNDTVQNRAKNRRVQFIIRSQTSEAAPTPE